jgi:hypothetical protein
VLALLPFFGICLVLLLAAEAKGNLAETPFVNFKNHLNTLKA